MMLPIRRSLSISPVACACTASRALPVPAAAQSIVSGLRLRSIVTRPGAMTNQRPAAFDSTQPTPVTSRWPRIVWTSSCWTGVSDGVATQPASAHAAAQAEKMRKIG